MGARATVIDVQGPELEVRLFCLRCYFSIEVPAGQSVKLRCPYCESKPVLLEIERLAGRLEFSK